jgi:hypothetical protein
MAGGVTLILYVLVLLNWHTAMVRLEPGYRNALFLLAAQLLPFSAMMLLWLGSRTIRSLVLSVVVVGPFLLCSLIYTPFLWLEAVETSTGDPGYQEIQRIPVGRTRVTVYRTDVGGATTGFGIYVRQEFCLVPGVLLVRDLGGFYPASQASATLIGPNTVRVESTRSAGMRSMPVVRDYILKRFLYF